MLQVEQLSSGYSMVEVVREVSFTLRPGDRVALVGPNGAGKTTLLETIAGFVKTFSGRVKFGARDLTDLKPEQRARCGVALVTEMRNLFSDLTVAEHLKLGRCCVAGAGRWDRLAVDRATERVLVLFPKLRQIYHRRAAVMSGGEQQMLAVGRALMAEPKILMLDEPTQGLSPQLVEAMYAAISAIGRDVAILLVEQDIDLARTLTDTVNLMLDGRIRQLSEAEMSEQGLLASEIFGR